MEASEFIGMSKQRAQDKAERLGIIFRLIRVDSKDFFTYPEDVRTDRICIEIDRGSITKASIQ